MTIETLDRRKAFLMPAMLVLEFLIVCFLSLRNLGYDYLWYDEAGQFWIAKGLNHDSPPFSKVGGLLDVIENNKYYNLDPGGFSILEHYWTKISNSILWLRILPFLFLIGVSIFSGLLFNRLFKQKSITVLLLIVPFLMPTMLTMGFEIRAYSMEVFGLMLLLYGLFVIRDHLSVKNILLFFSLSAVFMTSRYSESLLVVIGAFYVAFLIFKSNDGMGDKLAMLCAMAAPLLLGAAYIYFFSFRFQNPGMNQLNYLQYIKNSPSMLFKPVNLVYLFLLASIGLVLIYSSRIGVGMKVRSRSQAVPIGLANNGNPSGMGARSGFQSRFSKYNPLLVLCLGGNLLIILLSFMGYYPWRVGSKGNLTINYLMILSVLALSFETFRSVVIVRKYAPLLGVTVIAIAIVYGYDGFLYPKRDKSIYPMQDMHCNTPYRFHMIESPMYKKVFVESWENPYIRYAYEYGVMKSSRKSDYPHRFYLQKGVPHHYFPNKDSLTAWRSEVPSMNELMDFDLLVTSELFDWSKSENDKWHKVKGAGNLWEKNR